MQKDEINGYYIYSRLAVLQKDINNAAVLRQIAEEEKKHYKFWEKQTGKELKPGRLKIGFFMFVCRVFGLTFGIKLMENGEEKASAAYEKLTEDFPEAKKISAEEEAHEKKLLNMLDEERLKYVGSIVLGLNDALVELTGALAGLSFAFQNTRTIAMAGLITGIAAALSMAASEYLSTRTEEGENALKSSLYTGIAYILTVAVLILPYFLFPHYLICLSVTLGAAVLIIFLFNYYISVAKDLPFWKRFLEMAVISLGVSAFSFLIGFLIRRFLGIDI